jgi:hypothetical protein
VVESQLEHVRERAFERNEQVDGNGESHEAMAARFSSLFGDVSRLAIFPRPHKKDFSFGDVPGLLQNCRQQVVDLGWPDSVRPLNCSNAAVLGLILEGAINNCIAKHVLLNPFILFENSAAAVLQTIFYSLIRGKSFLHEKSKGRSIDLNQKITKKPLHGVRIRSRFNFKGFKSIQIFAHLL